MVKIIILFLLLILPVQLFPSEIPSIKEVREQLSQKDSLRQIILEDYLEGRQELDWKTQMSWDNIIAEIYHDFEEDSSAFGRVFIRFGYMDSTYRIDRIDFLKKKLQRELINTDWELTEWYIEYDIWYLQRSNGYVYRWRIEPAR